MLEILDIIYDHAYGNLTDMSDMRPSPSLVHLLRLFLNNLGVWELPVNMPKWRNVVEKHLDKLIYDPDHPFGPKISKHDILFGHPSALALARLFVSGIRFVLANERLPKDKAPPEKVLKEFYATFDHAMEGIRHPILSAQLLRFRSLLLERPDTNLLFRIWEYANQAEWKNPRLWYYLLQYAVAVNVTYMKRDGRDSVRTKPHFYEDLETTFDVAETITNMPDEEVVKVLRRLKEGQAPASINVISSKTRKQQSNNVHTSKHTTSKTVPASLSGSSSSHSKSQSQSQSQSQYFVIVVVCCLLSCVFFIFCCFIV